MYSSHVGWKDILESSRCLGSTKKNSQNKCPFCIILLHLLAQLPRVEWGVSAINPDSNQAFSFRLHSLQCMNSFWIQEKVILHDELVFETSKFSKGGYSRISARYALILWNRFFINNGQKNTNRFFAYHSGKY